MTYERDTNNMLSVLDNYTLESEDDIALKLAEDFRHRRIEKNMTREDMAQAAGIAVSNLVRFEQKGLVSLKNLIALAMPWAIPLKSKTCLLLPNTPLWRN